MNKKIIGIMVCVLFFGASVTPSIAGFDKDVEKTDYILNENESLNMKNDDYNNLMKQVIESGSISNDNWTEQDKLLASDGGADNWLGISVSIDGEYAIIGAPGKSSNQGFSYIFKRTGTSWNEQAKLVSSDGEADDWFGFSVSINGDYALIGAPQDDDNGEMSGSAYVFKRDGNVWTQEAKLLPSDGASGDYFGGSVSINSDYVIVGAFFDNDNGDESGSAYVFKLDGNVWTQEAKLLPSDGDTDDRFGCSVSISGDYAIIGAHNDGDFGGNSGSAYVFKLDGNVWTQEAKLLPSDGASGDHFGCSVSISGDYAIIGASYDDDNGHSSGSVYIFIRSGSTWTEQAKLLPSDGKSGAYFGCSVSIDGDIVLIGAYDSLNGGTGSAYIFTRSGSTWTQQTKLLASDGADGDLFGCSVSINGEYAIIGAPYDNDNGDQSGSAYVFTKGSGPEPFYFVHITDTHVGTPGGKERFEYVVGKINELVPQPEYVVISGDLTHFGGMTPWDILDWITFKDVVEGLNMPFYLCIGNHDHLFDIPPYSWIIDLFQDFSISPENGVHLISMDCGDPGLSFIEDWKRIWIPIPLPGFFLLIPDVIDYLPEAPGFTQEQIDWLYSISDDYPEWYHKIIFMHHPTVCYHTDSIWPEYGETFWINGGFLNHRDDFMNFNRNEGVKVVLAGHQHDRGVEPREYKVDSNNYPSNLSINPGEDGFNIDSKGGYWSCSELGQTMYVITEACSEYLAYREIWIDGVDVKVYKDKRFDDPGEPDLKEYQSEMIPWPWIGKSINPIDNITAPGRFHVYDSMGNHVGINESGGIDCTIPLAYYEDEPIYNETTGMRINWTQAEIISLLADDEESYTFEIEVFLNSTLNLTGHFDQGFIGGEIITKYENITVYSGSIGNLYIDNGVEDYTLYLDDDDDGVVDREIEPTVIYSPPDDPDRPDGPSNGKPGTEYTYITSTNDPEGDQVYYLWNWSDGKYSGWLGPFGSDETATTKHIWSEKGNYEINVKAKDIYGCESEWSDPLVVTIPRDKIVNRPLLQFLQSHPNLFPILQLFLQKLGL